MQNIAITRNMASRLVYLVAEIQKTATHGQIVADNLQDFLHNNLHQDALFTDDEIQTLRDALALLAKSQERMKTLVMPDIQERCQAI